MDAPAGLLLPTTNSLNNLSHPLTNTHLIMRTIDSIIIHCSATPYGKDFTAADINRWHRQRNFNGIGYHFVIRPDGTIENGRPVGKPGAHCLGWNNRSIGICYIGGLDADGRPADTRTDAQKKAMRELIARLQKEHFGIRTIIGHRDTSPDLNGNGQIEPEEFIKVCPCFDVRNWLQSTAFATLYTGAFLLAATACGSHRSLSHSSETCDSSMNSQTTKTIRQQLATQALQKLVSDSSTITQDATEEYTELTTIIRRGKKSSSASQKHQHAHSTDSMKVTNNHQEEAADRTESVQKLSLQEEKKNKHDNSGNLTLLLIGGGSVATVLLYRQIQRKRQRNKDSSHYTEA